MNLLLKTNRGEGGRGGGGDTEGLILLLVVWIALIVCGWMVVACGRKSYLGAAKISSFVFLV